MNEDQNPKNEGLTPQAADSGLELRDDFKKRLRERLGKPSKRIPHEEVLKKLGQN